MKFESFVHNKSTELTVRRGDDTITLKWDYDVESLEDWVLAFQTVLKWLTYEDTSLENYFKEE